MTTQRPQTARGPATALAPAPDPSTRRARSAAQPPAGRDRGDVVREWRPPHPTDLLRTLRSLAHGSADPTQRVAGRLLADEHAALWRTSRMRSGATTMRLAQLRDGSLRVDAWGQGAEEAAASAPRLCGAEDDATAFDPLLEPIAQAHRRASAWRIPATGLVFEALVPVVLEQKVIVAQAQSSWRALVLRYGDPAPGPVGGRMRVAPSAAQWRRVPSWAWHRAGVDPQRSRTIVRSAERATAIDRLASLPSACAREQLELLPGVGIWTSAEVAQRAFGDADAVSVGDFHLANHVGHALEGRDFTDEEMLAALEPWRGQRFRAVRCILLAGPRRPRRGPKLEFVDHTAY